MSTNTVKIYRQGDVLIREIDTIPAGGLKKIEKDKVKDAVVLAYGEVTGHHHHHMFDPDAKVNLFLFENAERDTLAQGGSSSTFRPGASVPDLETSDPRLRRFLQVDQEVAFLRHEEHTHIAIPKGKYEVIIQQEYTPGATRQVTRRRWSPQEIQIIRQLYPEGEEKEIREALPNRTWGAIVKRANDLKVGRKATRIYEQNAHPILKELREITRLALALGYSLTFTSQEVGIQAQESSIITAVPTKTKVTSVAPIITLQKQGFSRYSA